MSNMMNNNITSPMTTESNGQKPRPPVMMQPQVVRAITVNSTTSTPPSSVQQGNGDPMIAAMQRINDFSAGHYNVLAKCMGPATDPLSYFDSHTEGGFLILKFHYDPSEKAKDSFLNYVRNEQNDNKCLRRLYAIQTELDSSSRLIHSRQVQLRYQIYQASSPSTSASLLLFPATAQTPFKSLASTPPSGALKDRAMSSKKIASAKNQSSANHTTAIKPKYVFDRVLLDDQLRAIHQAEALWNYASSILQAAYHEYDKKMATRDAVKDPDLYIEDPRQLNKRIIKKICQSMANELPTTSPHRIALKLALKTKDDVMGLSRTNAHAILQGIQEYRQNPNFGRVIDMLKRMNIVCNDFPKNRLIHGQHCVSTLHWLIMFYLEIPGFADKHENTPPFEPKPKESEHPDEWRTTSMLMEDGSPTKTKSGKQLVTLDAKNIDNNTNVSPVPLIRDNNVPGSIVATAKENKHPNVSHELARAVSTVDGESPVSTKGSLS